MWLTLILGLTIAALIAAVVWLARVNGRLRHERDEARRISEIKDDQLKDGADHRPGAGLDGLRDDTF